jgi:DNA end-binding protein Ku
VVNLMDALRRSIAAEPKAAPLADQKTAPPATTKAKAKKPRKRIEGQREMLLPISGKGGGKEAAGKEAAGREAAEKKAPKTAARPRRAG